MEELYLAIAITRIFDLIEAQGMSIEVSSDFKKFRKVAKKLKGKQITEQFSVDLFDLHEGNAFWIGIRDKEGKVISVHCSRTEEIRSKSLSDFWSDQQTRIYPKPHSMGKERAPLAKRISGTVAYHGDFWINPKRRGDPNTGIYVLFGLLVCQAKMDPDWIYGLMSPKQVKRGFLSMAGFDYGQPYAVRWELEPKSSGLASANWLVTSEREGILHRAEIIAKYGPASFQKEQKIYAPSES